MLESPHRPRSFRIPLRIALALLVLYALLLIPEPSPSIPKGAGQHPFLWNRDAFWSALETKFLEVRKLAPSERDARFNEALKGVHAALDSITTNLPPNSQAFDLVETNLFELAPVAAANPSRLDSFMGAAQRLRQLVKSQSENWPPDLPAARRLIYRLLYGARAAVEEALLQSPRPAYALEIDRSYDRPASPGAEIRGVTIYSGDILVSRGGAATSALIARGNDFPGNFSHIALVYVDEQTKKASVIEAHIESGVGVRPIETYLSETKLRIMVLRLRGNLPALAASPTLPRKAAAFAINDALSHHIPYDFAMDYANPSKQFCSEVASAAYSTQGIKLWAGPSHISSPGITRWLGGLGVRHFETQEPSDLEYDPQLRIVAEWRDPETLFKDHVDNAVIDALLEGADRGERLGYNLWKLPFARLAKAWSVALNLLGKVGPVPEGMSATTALRVESLTQRHAELAARVLAAAKQFKTDRGYVPPYWELLRIARAENSH
jgi:hypothetical protein